MDLKGVLPCKFFQSNKCFCFRNCISTQPCHQGFFYLFWHNKNICYFGNICMAKALLKSMGIRLLSKLGKMSTFILSLFLEVNSLHGQTGFLCHFSAKKSNYRENDSFPILNGTQDISPQRWLNCSQFMLNFSDKKIQYH